MEYIAYIIGWVIGGIIRICKFLFKTMFNISRVPAIKSAKWLAKKIKQSEGEGA
ncbi:MAG TPA: hypothetical protein VEF53_09405 [Patescibacteria group bacterium]|nr:hypothetical protein [Patescibacteria group bacterium]